jgi:hypothetical protein
VVAELKIEKAAVSSEPLTFGSLFRYKDKRSMRLENQQRKEVI